ncbi:hypothetical protein GE21DRAFT_1672 [Neurospora crassa]|uniref:Mesaconyl-C4 CoA hydratase n=1 Tax=Neurospora crassa (strain ATCC 24698 / 74-OR23-1A / CBS 708.71 / DSM 1257 / FGSC 987) TaxID=367110 RepID=Q7S228_NEUCR|nr:hypothetical protein NCU09886 [Neurospora crassa OR74A]EAA29417.1 hypothetical protein NCU09886 [Neurospora crassa OR74A]KHE82145.1 hypothetical protein GE21DRAFT_1672 [Neurospora crassa]|eukprot:XP_958653.1 hypothetical protein NCU09886 [Neurospora crassa OR74A]
MTVLRSALGRQTRPPLNLRAMSRPRSLSTTSSITASEAASQMLQTFQDKTIVRKQTLDGNQLQKLCLTLGRRYGLGPQLDLTLGCPPAGTPVPPGYHLVYFTPSELEEDLGADGTDRTFNAPAPFTRRMWAGGQMRWEDGTELRVGEQVEEHTKLLSAVAKKSRDGSEMVLVEVNKEFWGERGLALVDQRSWIFRKEIDLSAISSSSSTSSMPPIPPPPRGGKSEVRDVIMGDNALPDRVFKWSPAALFRFSALTFNAHMIHYNESWTRAVENHPGVVVHGPLNLINMLDYWRDVHRVEGSVLEEISYRATAPIYAGEEYAMSSSKMNTDYGIFEVLVKKGDQVCMTGHISEASSWSY